jgi:hypothetical protein
MPQETPMAKQKYTPQEAKKALPSVKDFNRIAGLFLSLLTQQITVKEDRIRNISVMLNDFKPVPKWHNTVNVQTIDMKEVYVRQQGQGSYTQTMKWEDDYKGKRKGIIL